MVLGTRRCSVSEFGAAFNCFENLPNVVVSGFLFARVREPSVSDVYCSLRFIPCDKWLESLEQLLMSSFGLQGVPNK